MQELPKQLLFNPKPIPLLSRSSQQRLFPLSLNPRHRLFHLRVLVPTLTSTFTVYIDPELDRRFTAA